MCEKKFPITTSKCEIDFLPLYNHVKENKGLAKEVFGNETGPMMRDHVKNIIIFALQSYLKNRLRSDVDKGLLPIMLESTGSALMAMLIGWSLKGMPVSTRIMAHKSQNIANNFFKDLSGSGF